MGHNGSWQSTLKASLISVTTNGTTVLGRYLLDHAQLPLEPFGGGRWRVRRVPAFLPGHPELIAGVVSDALGRGSADEAWRAVLGRLACLPALKAGHELAHAEAQTLLDALSACQTPWACPHGRPTALVLSELELARRFGRRGVRAAPPKVSEVERS